MSTKFSILRLFIVIALATVAYLFYVSEQRKKSIQNFGQSPKIGDVYKFKLDDDDGSRYLLYRKIKEITAEGIVYYDSKMKANQSFDIALKHFDSSEKTFLTHRQIKEILQQKKIIQNNPEIIEIIRKD